MKPSLSRAQFTAAIFLALLSPLIRIMPRGAAALAGRGCWLSPLPALALLGLYGWYYRRRLAAGESLGARILRTLGPAFGRAILGLFAAVFLLYAGFVLRVGADRLVVTVYPRSGSAVFYTVLTLLCLTAALGTLRALGRTAVILRAIMLAVLAMCFAFSLPDWNRENLTPLALSDAGGIFLGALPLVNVGGLFACFGFLEGYAPADEPPGRACFGWLAALMLTAALLCLSVLGSFGPALTLKMSYPFFVMVRDVSLLRLADRIEAVVIAIWIFSDFMMCTLMLRCAHEALRLCFSLPEPEEIPWGSLRGGRWLLLPEAAAVWCAAHFIANDSFALIPWSDKIMPALFAALIFGLLPLLLVLGGKQKK